MLLEGFFALTLACCASALEIKFSESDTLPLHFSCPAGSEKIELHGLQGKYQGEVHRLADLHPSYAEVEDAARAECASQYENEIPGSELNCEVTLNHFKAQHDFLIPDLNAFESFEMAYKCPSAETPETSKNATFLFGSTVMMDCPYQQEVKIVSAEDVEGQSIDNPSSFEKSCNDALKTDWDFYPNQPDYFCYVDGLKAATYKCQAST